MKKTKKLLAGLLSFAMLAGLVPTTWAEETPEWESKEGYLYYETFDNETYDSDFDVAETNTAWTNAVDVTNGKMVYTKSSGNATPFYHKAFYTMESGKIYKVGLTLDLKNITTGGNFQLYAGTNNNMPTIYTNGTVYKLGGGFGFSNQTVNQDYPVELVYVVNKSTNKVQSYVTYYTTSGEEQMLKSTLETSAHKDVKINVGDNVNMTGSFAIDEFYIQEVTERKVTYAESDGTQVTNANLLAEGKAIAGYIDGGVPDGYKAGYQFDKWYTDVTLQTPYVDGEAPDSDFTLYTKFSGDGTYISSSADIPTKDGYLMYEDFGDIENGDYTYYNLFDTTDTGGKWSNEVIDGKMVYTAASGKSNAAPIAKNIYPLADGKRYEVGMTMYLGDCAETPTVLSGNGNFQLHAGTTNNMPTIYWNGNEYKLGGGNGFNNEIVDRTKPIKLVFTVDYESATETVESTVTYTPKGATAESTINSTTVSTQLNRQAKINSSDSGLAGSFAIDNFYVKEVIDTTPVYTVTYKNKDNTAVELVGEAAGEDGFWTGEVKEGEIVGGVPMGYKAGYEFEGWYYDADCTDPYVDGECTKTENFTLYANFTGDGSLATATTTVPTKEGYIFYEDFGDADYYNRFDTDDTSGRWKNRVTDGQMVYTATSGVANANVWSGSYKTIYNLPTGYKYEVGVTLDLSELTNGRFIVFAGTNQNINAPVIWSSGTTFKIGGGNGFGDQIIDITKPVKLVYFVDFESATKSMQSYVTYTKQGQTEEETISSNVITGGNVGTQYASLYFADQTCVGSFALDDFYIKYPEKGADVTFVWGSTDAEKTTVSAVLGTVTPPANPSKEGATFKGWSYTDGSATADFVNKNIEEATTVYAVWQDEHKITFNNADGTKADEKYTVDFKAEAPATEPTPPAGKLFAGWFDAQGNRFNESVVHSADTVYTAQFSDNYTISFYINEGDSEAYATAEGTNGKITMPDEPTNAPYTFLGWYTASGALFTGEDLSEADSENKLSVYADWTTYVYKEDFSGEYNMAAYDTTDDGWQNEVKTAEDGNKYMSYTQKDGVTSDNSATFFNTKDKWNTAGVFKYTDMQILPNVDYETGYSFGLNNMSSAASGWMTSLRLIIEGNCIDISNWTLYNGTLTLARGAKSTAATDADGNAKTLTIRPAEVDGLINVKSFFNINGETSVVRNLVTYKNTSGKTVQDEIYFTFTTMYTGAENKQSGYGGSLAQINGGSVNADSEFIIDDIYVKYIPAEDKSVNVSFIDADGDLTFPNATATDGIVALPEVDEAYMVLGWYLDEDLTIPYNNNITAENNTLYLKKTVQYTLTLNTNTNDGVVKYHTIGSLADFGAYKHPSGLEFLGWYTDAELTEEYVWSPDDTISANDELWAKWSSFNYYIDFEDESEIPAEYMETFGDDWLAIPTAPTEENDTMVYMPNDYSGGDQYAFNSQTNDPTKYPLDRNSTYEVGYKLGVSDLYMMGQNSMSLNLIDERGNNYTGAILGWYGSGDTIHINGYNTAEDAAAKTNYQSVALKINPANIDGMLDVRIIFNINGDKATADNYTNNGTAKAIVEYKTIDGEKHRAEIYQNFKTAATWNANGYADYGVCAYAGTWIKASQVVNKSAEGGYIELDDVYFRPINTVDENVTVSFVADRADAVFTFTESTAVYGEVTAFPTITDDKIGIEGWYLDAECTIPYQRNATSTYNVLYAKTAPQYKVTMHMGDEKYADVVEYTITGKLSELSFYNNPVHQSGVRFNKWYADDKYTIEYQPPVSGIITGDIELYADWSEYLFRVDFENDADQEYDSYFETPLASNGAAQRWSHKIVDAADGTRYMEYTLDPEVETTGDNNTLMNANIVGKVMLDRNTTYEAGYKFDPNTFKGRMHTFSLLKLANSNDVRSTDIDGINDVTWRGTVNVSGQGINLDEVDGFIDVKIIFSINGANEIGDNTENNWADNGTGTRYVSYTKHDGTFVTYSEDFTFPSRSNDGYPIEALGAMRLGEIWVNDANITTSMSFIIDDIYVKPALSPFVMTYDAGEGTFANGESTMEFDIGINGVVRLPANPTREGYAFAGWFADAELTEKFKTNGWFNDYTAYARWQADPTATITVPTGKAGVKPTVTVEFDSEMNLETINKNNIVIMNGDKVLDQNMYELTVSMDKYFNTKVTITFNTTLDYDADYTVLVKKEVSNTKGQMTEDMTASFKTGKLMLRLEGLTVEDDNGENITAVTAGQNMNVKFNIFRADALN